MISGSRIAPGYAELRPLKAATSATFPVYKDLPDRLLKAVDLPDPAVAHVLGTCAGYAYANQDTVAMMMTRLGLEENRCLMIAETVDAMFICSTAFLVQSRCGRALILCYRGTEPVNAINWLTDADVNPQLLSFSFPNRPVPAEIHGGFYRNVRATRYAVVAALQRALNGQSIVEGGEPPPHALEGFYLTGHSLGGAMAALMGVMLLTEEPYRELGRKLKGIYTYGQPMVGNAALARACQDDAEIGRRFVRYVFAHDIVPELPPAASGDFVHFGSEYHLDLNSQGEAKPAAKPLTQLTHLADLLAAPFGFIAHQLKSLRNFPVQHSLYDHGPQNYVAALTPRGVHTEFGD
jgi:Lipase (class 3)